MKKISILEIAVLLNMFVVLFNIVIGFFNMRNGNIEEMLFNMGCAICSGLLACVCAIVNR